MDTKELIEPFPKEKDRSYKSNFSKFNSNSNSNSNSDGTDQSKNSEVIKNTKIIQNGFLGSGRSLNEMLECLTEEICEQVRAECGRDFTDRAIKQITKAVSRSKKGAKAVFYHINGLIAYLSKLLKFEKRDPVKVSSINYYITGNLTEEEKIIQKQEKYLTELEYSLQVSPEWHLKKKLAAVLERSKAYKLLTSYKSIDVREGEAKIYLNNHVELTQTEYDLILSQIQATHELLGEGGQNNQIDRVSIEMPDRLPSSRASKPETGLAARVGAWGTIRTIFANYFGDKGDGLDSSWLSRLEATFDETTKSLRLKAPSEFYKDYVSQHFLPELTSATSQSGFKLISIEC